MNRLVRQELLDILPQTDPRAIRSRFDLRRLNFFLGHAGILAREFGRPYAETSFPSRPLRWVELGAGDGTLFLRLARRLASLGVIAQVTLIDRHGLLSDRTRHDFAALGWSVESVVQDVLDWLAQPGPGVDIMSANLFLHHFADASLARLLRLAAARTNLFLACEPRRTPFALAAVAWLWFLGCNDVTRHDGVLSVGAGFTGRELSALWPADGPWQLSEHPAGLFSHCFLARKNG
jgi:hypothetical protein